MTKSGRHGQRPPGVDGEGARAGYEPPRIEVLGTIRDLTTGFTGAQPDNAINVGSGPGDSASDRRLKECVTSVDTRAVLRRVRAATEYLPPRLEVLGTIEELTMGGAVPASPDTSTLIGTTPTLSDRRLKEGVTSVDTRAVLRRVRAATEYLPPRLEVLGTIEDLTMGGAIPHPDSSTNMGSVAG